MFHHQNMAQKSLFLTYLLWFFGGIFGLHHFYLRRDFHALIWWMFAGGYFGAGWIRDLWKIPEYVADANEDPAYMAELAVKMKKDPKPSTSTFRYVGQFLVADAFGYLVLGAIPRELVSEDYIAVIGACLVPFATALGIYMVGNVGRHQGKLLPALLGAYLTSPLYFFMEPPIFLSSLAASFVFNSCSKEWRRTPMLRKSLWKRILFLVVCGLLYLSLWSSWLYFNCQLTYQDKEEVKCRDAAKHFFKSPMWKEFVSVMSELWESIQTHGWREVWKEIVAAFDPIGEANALKVLGLNATATQQEITSRYRKLSREWHPDKHKSPEEKAVAQEKFIEIQQAYEILSKIKSQRVERNIQNSGTSDDSQQ